MKYKVGDKVRIKSLDWYDENKDEYGFIQFDYGDFIPEMSQYCGEILTIKQVVEEFEQYFVSECVFAWMDNMIEEFVEHIDCEKCGLVCNSSRCLFMDDCPHNKQKNMIEGLVGEVDLIPKFGEYSDNEPLDIPTMTTEFVKEHGLPCPKGYQFKDENGNVINATKIVLEKKKKEVNYPKTYEECCDVLGLNSEITDSELIFYYPLKCGEYTTIRLPEMEKFEKFIQLYLCRNAYWKIAGEEFNWDNALYYIYTNDDGNVIESDDLDGHNYVLAFPNKASRDAFKENFDSDIEICKELL